jgi:hypothetical protein
VAATVISAVSVFSSNGVAAGICAAYDAAGAATDADQEVTVSVSGTITAVDGSSLTLEDSCNEIEIVPEGGVPSNCRVGGEAVASGPLDIEFFQAFDFLAMDAASVQCN